MKIDNYFNINYSDNIKFFIFIYVFLKKKVQNIFNFDPFIVHSRYNLLSKSTHEAFYELFIVYTYNIYKKKQPIVVKSISIYIYYSAQNLKKTM